MTQETVPTLDPALHDARRTHAVLTNRCASLEGANHALTLTIAGQAEAYRLLLWLVACLCVVILAGVIALVGAERNADALSDALTTSRAEVKQVRMELRRAEGRAAALRAELDARAKLPPLGKLGVRP